MNAAPRFEPLDIEQDVIEQGLSALHAPALWRRANVRMIEKALSELSFEGVIVPEVETTDDGTQVFTVSLDDGGFRWRGRTNRWQQPVVVHGSVIDLSNGEPATDATAVLAAVLAPLKLPAITLANYLRETLNTLAADTQMLASREGLRAADWLALPGDRLQSLLDGHPKAIPSKGRIGWGIEDNLRYGPERAPAFQLHWLAVRRDVGRLNSTRDWDADRLVAASCGPSEHARLRERLTAATTQPENYWLLPVHPWQWQGVIASQFAPLLSDGRMIALGEAGDRYTPQQSLRTLNNVDRPEQPNLKLPLTILNTSAYRGLPARYLAITPALSDWLQHLLASDALLTERSTVALAEPATAFVPHPVFHGLAGVPYQFDEMLGAVWRESTERRRATGERILMASVLQQCDDDGIPLAAELIRASKLSAHEWLTRLFDLAVVPLYHLQARHGLGFIAHGQNLMLRFENEAPAGILLKDYQGDLFRADAAWATPEGLAPEVWDALPTMPPHYLVHNLWTGLFASVFRFMASALHGHGTFDEEAFYRLLTERLHRYQDAHPQLRERFAELDLFTPQMPRLSLNRARFAAGYGDSAERPIHARGPDLPNPLLFATT